MSSLSIYDGTRRFTVNNHQKRDEREFEMLDGRNARRKDLEGLARKLLENEERLEKELASKYPDAATIKRLKRIIAQMEKYRDPNVKLR